MKKMLVLYHAHCMDGLAAAWCFWDRYPDAEFIPVKYYEDPPDVTGHDVFIVDFSYLRPVMEEMHEKADFLVCIDHHESAQDRLHGLDYCIFDMNQSGCILAWKYLNKKKSPPKALSYVEDRDLWKFELPDSKAVNEWMRSKHVKNAEEFDRVVFQLKASYTSAVTIGNALLRSKDEMVKAAIFHTTGAMILDQELVAVNSTALASEVGNELAAKHNLPAATWRMTGDHEFHWELRSLPHLPPVKPLAVAMGGGGHRNAAGFKVNLETHLKLLGFTED